MDEQTVKEPNPTMSEAPSSEKPSSGPPSGFGKGINEYLNHYVTVADAKAVALLAVDLIVLQVLLKDYFYPAFEIPFHIAAAALLWLSCLASILVVFPRQPRGSNGVIFWEDIAESPTPDAYFGRLSHIDKTTVEHEYAHQNFYASKVLHRKMKWTQLAIYLFTVGAAVTLVCIIW